MASRGKNLVILLGNLGADPEVRSTRSGSKVANLRLATAERRKQGDSWVDHTEWHKVVAFGRTAEVCEQYLTKGDRIHVTGSIRIHVTGSIRTNKWQDKQGNDRYTTEIIVDDLIMLGGSKSSATAGGSGGGSVDDDDIPF